MTYTTCRPTLAILPDYLREEKSDFQGFRCARRRFEGQFTGETTGVLLLVNKMHTARKKEPSSGIWEKGNLCSGDLRSSGNG